MASSFHCFVNATMEWLVLLLVSLRMGTASSKATAGDLDAYGIKIAGNDVLFTEVYSPGRTILVQMAPYSNTDAKQQCLLRYRDPAHSIYTVGVGSKHLRLRLQRLAG